MKATHHCNNGPCRVPPHPDLRARLRTQLLRVQGSPEEAAAIARMRPSSRPTGTHPGLNDGAIFPESHFEVTPSVRKLARAALERAPLRGSIRIAIILVDFSDKPMASGAKERFQDLFFSHGKIPTGSVTEYFTEVSNGNISLTGKIVGPLRMPLTSLKYANNDHGLSVATPNIQTLAAHALASSDGFINFNDYDNDGNGYVDAFLVVHAGPGGEQTGNKNDIWSAKWTLPKPTLADKVKVYAFLTIPENAYIGVCAHELGHLVFGWPDLYDTDYSSAGTGNWCLMSGGSWGGWPQGTRPCHPSAWCKANQGWVSVIVDTENQKDVTLVDVKSSHTVRRLWKNGIASGTEYFLIENRQTIGFDESLPGPGLLVWHVDESQSGNSDETHPMVGLEQADGLNQLQTTTGRGDAGDPYPGISNNRTFNATSNPNSKSYAGDDTFVSITDISASGPVMTMDITVQPLTSAGFSSKVWYRLRNTLPGYSLDVVNDGMGSQDGTVQMAREGNSPGQFWQIRPQSDDSYCLCTMFLGSSKRLDVYGDDKTKPHLATSGRYSEQSWGIQPWGDGTYHLSNQYSGPDMYLDTMEGGTRVAMNAANTGRPTQRWTIIPIRSITETGFEL